MNNLSFHITDITANSIRANASEIGLSVEEQDTRIVIRITDNGLGMDAETARRVTNPFYTTRTTRKVGLGLPFLIQNAEQTGGSVTLTSEPGKGTKVRAVFHSDHIDCPPWGDLPGTVAVIVLAGIVAVSVAGFNADATVGGGQQLIYEKVFSKDDFQKEAQTIRDYLNNNGARVSSLQPRENISDRDNYDAIVVNFTSDKPIESATINGVQCRLLEVDNARSAKLLKRASIALAAAVVIIYLYVLLRYLKIKGVYASLTVLIMMLWDFLVAAALVALFGFVGLQVNTYIMSVAAFVILYSAFNNVMLLSTLRSNEKNLKLEGEELVSLSVKQTLKRLLISCAVIVVLSLAAVFVCGGNVAQTCLALIIAVAVNTLSAIFAAPRLWMSLNK